MSATARIGVIVPSTNTLVERDFRRALPPGVSLHAARMLIADTTADGEREMVERHLPQAVEDLRTARVDVVVFACTSAAAVLGRDGEAELVERLGRETGARVVSTNTAVHRALERAGVRRVAAVTAYVDELTERIALGLREAGFEVPVALGMGIRDPFAIAEVPPAAIVALAERALAEAACDGLFVSCTNLPAMEIREQLAERFGVPVVTSNQATVDEALAAVGETV